MNNKRGRKKDSGVLSGIRPEYEWDEIRARIIYDSNEWPMVALQYWIKNLIKNGSQLPSNYLSASRDVRCPPYAQRSVGVIALWNKLCLEFEHAVLNGDADWFRRQWKSFESVQSQEKIRFNEKVVYLFEWATMETHSKQLQADFKAGKFEKCNAFTLTPAGKFTGKTASDIYDGLEKHEKDGDLYVEGCKFESKERAKDAIRYLAKLLCFTLKKQARNTK